MEKNGGITMSREVVNRALEAGERCIEAGAGVGVEIVLQTGKKNQAPSR